VRCCSGVRRPPSPQVACQERGAVVRYNQNDLARLQARFHPLPKYSWAAADDRSRGALLRSTQSAQAPGMPEPA
jgi:hypothetical protein